MHAFNFIWSPIQNCHNPVAEKQTEAISISLPTTTTTFSLFYQLMSNKKELVWVCFNKQISKQLLPIFFSHRLNAYSGRRKRSYSRFCHSYYYMLTLTNSTNVSRVLLGENTRFHYWKEKYNSFLDFWLVYVPLSPPRPVEAFYIYIYIPVVVVYIYYMECVWIEAFYFAISSFKLGHESWRGFHL